MSKVPDLTDVKSTNLSAIGWKGGELFVRFKGGGPVYRYSGVPEHVFHAGLTSDSPGQWFREHVRGAFVHHKLDA